MANLRYQQPQIQQTENGTKKRKATAALFIVFGNDQRHLFLLLIFLHLSRASEAALFSRAFRTKLSEPMPFMGEFFCAALIKGSESISTPTPTPDIDSDPDPIDSDPIKSQVMKIRENYNSDVVP